MQRILFICLGNICRSVTAEEVFRTQVVAAGLSGEYEADSAGLIDYHEGELADNRMRRHAQRRGYVLTHRSRPVVAADFSRFDLIVAMDENNVRGLMRIAGNDAERAKIVRMTDYLTHTEADVVPDPYYGGASDFEHVLDLLEEACAGLLAALQENKTAT